MPDRKIDGQQSCMQTAIENHTRATVNFSASPTSNMQTRALSIGAAHPTLEERLADNHIASNIASNIKKNSSQDFDLSTESVDAPYVEMDFEKMLQEYEQNSYDCVDFSPPDFDMWDNTFQQNWETAPFME